VTATLIIRPAIPSDRPDLRAAIIELQHYERGLHSTRLPGEQVADAHLDWLRWLQKQLIKPFWIHFRHMRDARISRTWHCLAVAGKLREISTLYSISRLRITALAVNTSALKTYEQSGFAPYEILHEKPLSLDRRSTETGFPPNLPSLPLHFVRRWFAEELRFAANLRSPAVVRAFATVPRERFVGPGPWRIRSRMSRGEYWTTESADPCHVYHDALIALDEARGLNNGQPSLCASFVDALDVQPGQQVLHLGCGTGYYSAILAELVGAYRAGNGAGD
jgi:hypothetical protein